MSAENSKMVTPYDVLNKVGRLEEDFPTKKIKELEINRLHKVNKFRTVKTKWGEKVVALLDTEFNIFLPSRLSTRLIEEEPEEYKGLKRDAARSILFLRFLAGEKSPCEFVIVNEESKKKNN